MKRRSFLGIFGAGVAALPVAAKALIAAPTASDPTVVLESLPVVPPVVDGWFIDITLPVFPRGIASLDVYISDGYVDHLLGRLMYWDSGTSVRFGPFEREKEQSGPYRVHAQQFSDDGRFIAACEFGKFSQYGQ